MQEEFIIIMDKLPQKEVTLWN